MLLTGQATRTLDVRVERFDYAQPFEISGYVFDHSQVVVATIGEAGHSGTGEASGVYYLDDGVEEILRQIEEVRPLIERGISRTELQAALPRSGARNALDCAMWSLEASLANTSVAAVLGLTQCVPLTTTITIGVASPEAMARSAEGMVGVRAIKLKLEGSISEDAARVAAVRAARPDVWLAVDANQGFAPEELGELMAILQRHNVSLLEQPLPRGSEESLRGVARPIPVAADESVLDSADLAGLVGLFDVINIKLDKCGGLTEALSMAGKARELGFDVMVGNMMGTSRAMAPAFLLGQQCSVVDLDGPTFLATDSEHPVKYLDGKITLTDARWA